MAPHSEEVLVLKEILRAVTDNSRIDFDDSRFILVPKLGSLECIFDAMGFRSDWQHDLWARGWCFGTLRCRSTGQIECSEHVLVVCIESP